MDWERVVDAHADKAYGFASALCGNEDDARELVQEAFARAMAPGVKPPPEEGFGAWFLTVLKHLYVDGTRRYERRCGQSLDEPIGPGLTVADAVADGREAPILDQLERKESAAAVRRAMRRLPPAQRAVLLLVDFHGYGYEEAARALGAPSGTMRSRLFRAREALRERLTGLEEAR